MFLTFFKGLMNNQLEQASKKGNGKTACTLLGIIYVSSDLIFIQTNLKPMFFYNPARLLV